MARGGGERGGEERDSKQRLLAGLSVGRKLVTRLQEGGTLQAAATGFLYESYCKTGVDPWTVRGKGTVPATIT